MIKEEVKFSDSQIMEGFISIRSVIAGSENRVNDRKITEVLLERGKEKGKEKELYYLRSKAEKLGFTIKTVSKDEIDGLAIGSTHGGMIAKCTERTVRGLDALSPCENGFFVMLRGIEDPYNFGYCLRSLYAAGVNGVILDKRNWLGAAGVVARASAGASELTDMYICDDISKCVDIFKEKSYRIASSDMTDNAVSVYDADMSFPLLLIVGGEKRGIDASLLKASDITVKLEYGRTFSGALSAASAASVIAFEVFRQNRKTKK